MEKVKVFLLGVIMAIGLMFLIGASHGQTGRYQVSVTDIESRPFVVIDTTTGDVYSFSDPTQWRKLPMGAIVIAMTKSYEIKEE